MLDAPEVYAWRLLLLSKAKEIYPDYDTAFNALDRYYRAVLDNFVLVQNRTVPAGAPPDYQREIKKNADAARKSADALEKQILALSKLNKDPDWRRHMNTSWSEFPPVRLEEITKVARSKS